MESAPDEGRRARLEALADTLWAERHLVEFLLYKLTVAKLILAADERRFVSVALSEVERIIGNLREAEADRNRAVADVARDWDRPAAEITLGVLAEEAPEPMRSVFDDHHRGFNELSVEIEETAAENRRLASGALNSIQAAIEALTGPATTATYDAAGRTRGGTVAPTQWDQVL